MMESEMILKGFKLLKAKPSGKLPVSYAQNYSQDTVIAAVDGFVDTPVDIDDPGFPEPQQPKYPNEKMLEKLYAEFHDLVDAGQYDQAAFERLYPQFREAAGDFGDFLSPLYVATPDEWFSTV